MKVNKGTTYKDFEPYEPYVSDDDKAKIKKAAIAAKFGDNGFYAMKVGAFLSAYHCDFGVLYDDGGTTAFDVYRAAAFADWLKDFCDVLDNLTMKPDLRQMKSQQGCVAMTFDESVFIFCRNYFGLQRFDDVLKLSVADYLMAKKDDYNRQVIDRNASKQM